MNDDQLAKYLFNERRPILYLQDPGHGWFSVKRAALDALGVLDRVTPYSYQRGASVYLEEDCDAGIFLAAYYGKHKALPKLKHSNSNGSSRIRGFNRLPRGERFEANMKAALQALREVKAA